MLIMLKYSADIYSEIANVKNFRIYQLYLLVQGHLHCMTYVLVFFVQSVKESTSDPGVIGSNLALV